MKPDGTAVKYVWAGAQRVASKASTGALLFYHPNHLGSTDLVTDAAGTQVAHYEYTPYGELWSTEGVSVPHKYTGKELDPETGFYFYEARYYDPQLGRFLTPDTIVPAPANPQSFNRYTYANNNPLTYTDPTGHKGWNPFRGIARALGAVGRTVVSAVAAAVVFVVTLPAGVQTAAAAAAATFAYTSTFLNASAAGASYWQAQGAATVNGLVAFAAVYVGWQAGPLAGAAIGASAGAAAGATAAAILGGDPGRGALSGAVGGAIMGGAGGALGVPGALAAAAGAGAASAAVAGGNVAQGAYLGAIGAATFAIASGSFQAAIDAGRAKAGVAADGPMATKVVFEKSGQPFAMRGAQAGDPAASVPEQMQSLVRYGNAYVQAEHPVMTAFLFGSAEAGGLMVAGTGAALLVSAAPLLSNPLTAIPGAAVASAGIGLIGTGGYIMAKGPEWASDFYQTETSGAH